jgi:hypothetical protein
MKHMDGKAEERGRSAVDEKGWRDISVAKTQKLRASMKAQDFLT